MTASSILVRTSATGLPRFKEALCHEYHSPTCFIEDFQRFFWVSIHIHFGICIASIKNMIKFFDDIHLKKEELR